MYKICKVLTSKKFEKQLKAIPSYIKEAALIWVNTVEDLGIFEVRKLKGYHDEALRGNRLGQRSVRLNRSYRLFYSEDSSGSIHLITIDEVNKHDY
ncbi:MAG: hypothetical protein A2381_16430 [Bdellovibrionales bacterium RIFOXYB1_FULL_37_110]|nr:MAG: hypothetical protein A2381_16430 [Bdellovibrionales bacterium RIFOXYB1_FULL_37_110]